jgi:hypothetical protein
MCQGRRADTRGPWLLEPPAAARAHVLVLGCARRPSRRDSTRHRWRSLARPGVALDAAAPGARGRGSGRRGPPRRGHRRGWRASGIKGRHGPAPRLFTSAHSLGEPSRRAIGRVTPIRGDLDASEVDCSCSRASPLLARHPLCGALRAERARERHCQETTWRMHCFVTSGPFHPRTRRVSTRAACRSTVDGDWQRLAGIRSGTPRSRAWHPPCSTGLAGVVVTPDA